ncbi:hypothetical protein Egran_06663 [Elaphomyces granulatus]|uniref:NB-ARC domain-containing protein n=1 Tax=Elaphomyces granulatus TaxID=519963 RepID=A0A232LN45_9EURO|nr:hypothetical protein Egran_06663 [Elaphomyces granulatus]
MGKTQLAIRFARDHKDDFTAIFWLNGKDRGTLLQSLSSVLSRLPGQYQNFEAISEEERHREIHAGDNIDQYYSATDSTIDGCTRGAYDIYEFFPTADHGSILITSRLQRLTELGMSFPIQRLEPGDAIQLLLQSSGLSAQNTTGNVQNNPGT